MVEDQGSLAASPVAAVVSDSLEGNLPGPAMVPLSQSLMALRDQGMLRPGSVDRELLWLSVMFRTGPTLHVDGVPGPTSETPLMRLAHLVARDAQALRLRSIEVRSSSRRLRTARRPRLLRLVEYDDRNLANAPG